MGGTLKRKRRTLLHGPRDTLCEFECRGINAACIQIRCLRINAGGLQSKTFSKTLLVHLHHRRFIQGCRLAFILFAGGITDLPIKER